MQSTINFLREPDAGNCWQTHSTNDSISTAKSTMFRSRSSGMMSLFVSVTAIEACKYSSFDLSNSAVIPSAVNIRTDGEDRVPQHRAKVTFGSGNSSPYVLYIVASFLDSSLVFKLEEDCCLSMVCSIVGALILLPPIVTVACI